jgi:hypothetical protein
MADSGRMKTGRCSSRYIVLIEVQQLTIRRLLLLLDLSPTEPGHIQAAKNKQFYKKILAASHSSSTKFVNKRKLDAFRSTDEYQNYERLCRGEQSQEVFVNSVLSGLI